MSPENNLLQQAIKEARAMTQRPVITDWKAHHSDRPGHALKAAWEVWSGLHPGHYIPGSAERWLYTSGDYEADCRVPPEEETTFSKYMKEAHDYAMRLANPAYCNFVETRFIWL